MTGYALLQVLALAALAQARPQPEAPGGYGRGPSGPSGPSAPAYTIASTGGGGDFGGYAPSGPSGYSSTRPEYGPPAARQVSARRRQHGAGCTRCMLDLGVGSPRHTRGSAQSRLSPPPSSFPVTPNDATRWARRAQRPRPSPHCVIILIPGRGETLSPVL